MKKKICIIAISTRGMDLGDRLCNLIGGCADRETIASLNKKDGWNAAYDKLSDLVMKVFEKYDGIVMIMSTGIAVRVISPCITKKNTDPAVIVMDEKGKYIISLISGHLGGANKLTEELAHLTGSQPVITTATDINNLIAVDSLALQWGMDIEPLENIVFFNRALLDGQQYTFWVDDSLEKTSLDMEVFDLAGYTLGNEAWNVIISNKKYKSFQRKNDIFLRPRNIILGIGCRKNYSPERLIETVEVFFQDHDLSLKSLAAIATIDLKEDEKAIVNLAQVLNIPLMVYSKEELNSCYQRFPFLKKSQFVKKTVETPGVCEPAALLAAQYGKLLLGKTTFQGVALAVAQKKDLSLRKEFSWFK